MISVPCVVQNQNEEQTQSRISTLRDVDRSSLIIGLIIGGLIEVR